MDLEQIRELLKIVAESGVSEVEVEEADFKLVVRKHTPSVTVQSPALPYGMPYAPQVYPPMMAPMMPPAAPVNAASPVGAVAPEAPPAAEPPANEYVVHAPIVGTFYRKPSPESEPYVKVGDAVQPGDVLCIIEAMKLMNEIECEVSGTIKQILVDEAHPVEYDQPLFIVEQG